MKKILFATDFSSTCSDALSYLLQLVEGEKVSIDLIHVYQIPVSSLSVSTASVINVMIEEKKKSVTNMINELSETIPEDIRGEHHCVYGVWVSSDINKIAENIGASFIVMALRQKYSFFDRLMGTVTAQTIDKVNVPVLAIPSGCQYSGIQEILFPTQLEQKDILESDEEEALYKLYNFTLLSDNPNVNILHIVDNEKGIDIHFKDKPFEQMNYTTSFAKNIDEGILNFVEKRKTDLIVILKKNRNFWQRLYHSSVTRKLLFKSRIPLFILS